MLSAWTEHLDAESNCFIRVRVLELLVLFGLVVGEGGDGERNEEEV